MVVESSESEPEERPRAQLSILGQRATHSKKRTKAHAAKSSKSSASVVGAGVGRKKQKAFGPKKIKKPTIISREDPLGAEIYQKAKDLQDYNLEERVHSVL
ncbi:hypothetical protein EV1_043912 [Malus domestica]